MGKDIRDKDLGVSSACQRHTFDLETQIEWGCGMTWTTRSAQENIAVRRAGLEKQEHRQTLHSAVSTKASGTE